MEVYTIGHSTRSMELFVDVLNHYKIELLIDVRRFPGSRKFPWFSKENLEKELPKSGIEYLHYPDLGGFRKEGYEAFAKSEEFNKALDGLLRIIDKKRAVILCAEILWWRCHRRYISNALVERGVDVTHIFDTRKTQKHGIFSSDVKSKMKSKILCNKAKTVKSKSLRKV